MRASNGVELVSVRPQLTIVVNDIVKLQRDLVCQNAPVSDEIGGAGDYQLCLAFLGDNVIGERRHVHHKRMIYMTDKARLISSISPASLHLRLKSHINKLTASTCSFRQTFIDAGSKATNETLHQCISILTSRQYIMCDTLGDWMKQLDVLDRLVQDIVNQGNEVFWGARIRELGKTGGGEGVRHLEEEPGPASKCQTWLNNMPPSQGPLIPPARQTSMPITPNAAPSTNPSTTNTTTPPLPPPPNDNAASDAVADSFTLTSEQLGKNMPSTFASLPDKPGFANRAKLPWVASTPISNNVGQDMIPEEQPDVQWSQVEPRPQGGMYVSRYVPRRSRHNEDPFPELQVDVPRKSKKACLAQLEESLGTQRISSSIGRALPSTTRFTARSRFTRGISCITCLILHMPTKHTRASPIQDLLRQCIRRTIDSGPATLSFKFEDWVCETFEIENPKCMQWLRHLNIFFDPKDLTAAGIQYDIVTQGPGEVVITHQYQYHQVYNVTPTLAIATNFIPLDIQPHFYSPDDPFVVCQKCGLASLFMQDGCHVRFLDSKSDSSEPQTTLVKRSKTRRRGGKRQKLSRDHESPSHDESEVMLQRMKHLEVEGQFVVPLRLSRSQTMGDSIVPLALAITSRPAIRQFLQAVKLSKGTTSALAPSSINSIVFFTPSTNTSITSAMKAVAQRLKRMDTDNKKQTFYKIMRNYDQYQLAMNWASLVTEEECSQRMSTHAYAQVMQTLCDMSGSTVSAIKDRKERGKLWVKLFTDASFDVGLLSFLPYDASNVNPFGVRIEEYLDLVREDAEGLETFRRLLDIPVVGAMCRYGRAWLEDVDEKGMLTNLHQGRVWDIETEDEVVKLLGV
ncbi:hypothetical protein BKA59DRAFT_517218 [Fusarium tricinctum]|uniref:JmjC domain-containing protein n=1 Tax=Fusarium tricinctum TaxID=61284 RepID=A0A8K0W5J6_9HYPO|nr:hypothetical protein BKA59DRAFT_517218 [Fusarium tricinctum]